MIAYLDTNAILFLAAGRSRKISRQTRELLKRAELFISPMVLIEIEYLYERSRIQWRSRDIQAKIGLETPITICTLPFQTIARAAVEETWTRDTFDRIIVAQAKANGLAYLISSDETIAKHYPRTVW